MKYEKLSKYVKLTQGQVVNKDTAHLFSDTKDENFIYPLYRIADLQTGDKEHCSRYVSRDVAETVIVQPNNILFSRVTCECFRGFSGVFHNNLFKVELLNETEIIEDYLFVVLKSDFVKKQAERLTSSSVVPDLTHSLFKSIIIPVPSKAIQKEIVKTYNSIMGKFLINTKTISELEAMAKTLYDYWFLQFDFPDENGKPYKSSGGKMVWNEELKREIPKGWEIKEFSSIFKFVKGKIPDFLSDIPTDNYDTPYITIEVANNALPQYCNKKGMIECIGETMVVMDGAASGDVYVGKTGSLGSTLAKLISQRPDVSNNLIYMIMNSYKSVYKKSNIGSTVPHANRTYIEKMKIALPKDNTYYSGQFDIIYKKIILVQKENQELSSLRDFLLPMLMNSQVTFKESK